MTCEFQKNIAIVMSINNACSIRCEVDAVGVDKETYRLFILHVLLRGFFACSLEKAFQVS